MPLRPEAQRRLQQGFQKRVRAEYRKYASQHQQAVTLATTFHLGQLQGIFALKQQSTSETVFGSLFILLILCSIVGVSLVGMALNHHPSGVTIARSILALAVLGGGVVLSGWLWLRPPRYLWLYAFTDGVAVGSPPSLDQHIMRWEHVSDIRTVWTDLFSPVSEETALRCTAYELRLQDGRAVVIPRAFLNMLDPYRSVGPLIRALVPPAVAQTFPSFPVIDEIIMQHLTHHVLPGALAAYQAGRTLAFGEVTVSTLGVSLAYDQPLIPWSDVKRIALENGALTIMRHSSRKPDQLSLAEIPNVGVLEVLFKEGLRAQQAGEPSSRPSEQ